MSLFSSAKDFLKTGIYNYVQLEANEDEHTFATQSGGLLTMIEIVGTNKITSKTALSQKHESLTSKLSGVLASPGRRLQIVFMRDPSTSRGQIESQVNTARSTMSRLNLDLAPMLDERVDVLTKGTAVERCYLVIETSPLTMSKEALKRASKARVEASLPVGVKPGRYGQSPFVAYEELKSTHESFVFSVTRAFTTSGLINRVLTAHEAVTAIRMETDPENTSEKWRPTLLGDKISPRLIKESSGSDQSHLMQPSIGYQLFSTSPEVATNEKGGTEWTMVKVGNRINAPILIDMGPQDPQPFMTLFNSIEKDVPWRVSFLFESGSEQVKSKLATKRSFASFFKFSNSNNSLIAEACEQLMAMCDEGSVLMTAQITANTWADTVDKVQRNKSLLMQALQGWGYIQTMDERGDPFQAFMNSIPAVSDQHIAMRLPMTLDDAFWMTPMARPASPWKRGSLLYRTVDDKLFPYLPGSSKQTAWTSLTFAPPGFGKSVHLAAENMSLILAPGNRILPRISIIDIGFSSAAFVGLIKNSLPENKKHLAEAFKIEMDPQRFMINPFDTPLGCNYPMAVDREWLINFLTMILTPANEKEGVSRLGDLVGLLVQAMYEYFDKDANPKPYSKGIDVDVDNALIEHEIDVAHDATWYEIRDALFTKGLPHEAGLAQRHALPNLNDSTEVLANRREISDLYETAKYKGEPLLDYVTSALVAAIRSYPILSGPSIFDTGSARIMSMDLSNVAKGGNAEADKKTGVMYMLARQIMCKEFYRNQDTLNEVPEAYRAYHTKLIEAEESVPKKICMDEFHRTKNSRTVREQVIQDVREGRKFNCHVSLLSQSIDDFDENMVEFATNIYILSKGITEETANKIAEKFKPSRDAMRALDQYVNGPIPGEGSTLLYIGSIQGGGNAKIEHPIRLTLGPIELWAYTTTHEDVIVRKRLTKEVGLGLALKILAKEYPSGVKKEIERMKTDEKENVYSVEDVDDIYGQIVDSLIKKYKKWIG